MADGGAARPFRFGVQTGPFDDAGRLRDFARRVEAQGYAELFTFDHIGAVDPFVPLVVAAEATTTLRLGPLVLNNEFHNPVLLARTAATFDRLTSGRLVLGMGTGYLRAEHESADIALRPPAARVTRLGESLAALRALLDTGAASCAGDEVRIAVDDLGVRPAADRVPLLIGGHGRRVVELAARYADVFQFTGLTHAPRSGQPGSGGFDVGQLRERRTWLQQAAGPRFADIDLSALVQITAIGDGAPAARQRSAERLDTGPETLDELPFVLIGSVDEIVDKLRRLRDDLGIHHYVVRDPDGFAPVVSRLSGT